MAKDEKPQDYKGPREPIITKNPCGFCNAGDHGLCRHELPYYEKLWICPCECNKGWVPQDLGSTTDKKRRKNEVRDMQLSADSGQHEDAGDPSVSLPESFMQDGYGSVAGRAANPDPEPSGE